MEQYISKSAIVAKIRSRLHPVAVQHETNYDDWDRGADSERLNILSFIDTLEVKEVDLDNELDFVKDAYYYFTSDEKSSMMKVARHFFILGLNAQKGE